MKLAIFIIAVSVGWLLLAAGVLVLLKRGKAHDYDSTREGDEL